jgi:hypothetical protein
MATTNILQFAEDATTGVSGNMYTDAEYIADPDQLGGVKQGIAKEKLHNKTLKQTTLMTAGLAKFIADNQVADILDTLTPDQIADYLIDAVQSFSGSSPAGYKNGFQLTNNATDSNNDIDFAPGYARNSANTADIILAAAITKRLDAAWSAGNNQGGLFSGSKANSTWYHCFVIRSADGSIIDAGFDTSITAANAPAGYTYAYINSIRTDGSGNILGFINFGKKMYLKTPVKDVTATFTTTSTNYTLTVPPGLNVLALMTIQTGSTGTVAYVRNTAAADIALGGASQAAYVAGVGVETDTTLEYGASYYEVVTNQSSQVAVRTQQSGACSIVTLGWELP